MLKETIWRGRVLVEREEVLLISKTSRMFHFQVKQRSGTWTDVWYENKNGTWMWNCNASGKKKNGDSFGCVLFKKVDKTKVYCSHTLACSILLDNMKKRDENNETNPME